MLTILAIGCLIIWLPVFVYLIARRGFAVLLIWLLIGPVASNVVSHPSENPFCELRPVAEREEMAIAAEKAYLTEQTTIKLNEVLDPTRIIVAGCLALFLLDSLLKKKFVIPFDRTEICMAVFCLILILGVILQSRNVAFGLHVAIDSFIIPFGSYFLARRFVMSEDRLRQVVRMLAYAGAYLIVVCLVERLTHPVLLYRLKGPFINGAILLSITMEVVFFVALVDMFGTRDQLPRSVRWFVLCLAPVIVLFTWSRGNWLGLLLGVATFLFLGRQFIPSRDKILATGLVLVLLSVSVVAMQILAHSDQIGGRVLNEQNVYGRFATWMIVLKEFGKSPIFGLGLNNLRDILGKESSQVESANSFKTEHNSFLGLLAETGIVGFMAYLAVIGSIFQSGLKLCRNGLSSHARWAGIGVVSILVAYEVPGLFASTLKVVGLSHVYVYFLVGGILGLFARQESAVNAEKSWLRTSNYLQGLATSRHSKQLGQGTHPSAQATCR